MPSAVVVGSGPNGLAGALTLARAGYAVEVREAAPAHGGGVRTGELTLPGFRHDVCSAIHPLGRASPFFQFADLGLDWVSPPAAVAHPLDDGTAVLLECDLRAVDLGADTDAYRRLVEPIVSAWQAVEPLVLGPFPPPLSALRALLRLAPAARAAVGDARSVAGSTFETKATRALFAGLAGHSMLPARAAAERRLRDRARRPRPRGRLGLSARRSAGNRGRARP